MYACFLPEVETMVRGTAYVLNAELLSVHVCMMVANLPIMHTMAHTRQPKDHQEDLGPMFVWKQWQVTLFVAAVKHLMEMDVDPTEVESIPELRSTAHAEDLWSASVAGPYATRTVCFSK